jgi:hypothetical protein
MGAVHPYYVEGNSPRVNFGAHRILFLELGIVAFSHVYCKKHHMESLAQAETHHRG